MNLERTPGARFALWWVSALTRTAEGNVAEDRRAEVASDVHEQLADAAQRERSFRVTRELIGRVVRGMPADLVWRAGLEVRPHRYAWHLKNPSTAITSLLVLMFPLNIAADSAFPTYRDSFVDYRVPLWTATDFVAVCVLALAVAALVARVRTGWLAGAESFRPRSRLERARRCVTAALGVALAGSAITRFSVLSSISGVLWFSFIAGVLVYIVLVFATMCAKYLTLGRYLPKMEV